MPDLKDQNDRAHRERLIELARKAGADGADAVSIRSRHHDVSIRNGALEDAGSAESFGIGLRVFKGARHAYGSTADISREGLENLVAHVTAMADEVPEDPYTKLVSHKHFEKNIRDFDLYDPAPPPAPNILADLARRAETAAMAHSGITRSDSASAGYGQDSIGLTTSAGFDGTYAHTSSFVSVTVIGGEEGEGMETDSASTSANYFADLESPEDIGNRAARRTLEKLGSRTGKTGQYPIVFDRRVSASLLRHLSKAVSGPILARRTSFLNDRLGTKIIADGITIIDDPTKKRGHRSMPFDAESLPVKKTMIVENGILQGLFLDTRSALRLGMEPTGHATRGLASPPAPSPSNLWIEAGQKTPEDILKEIGEGFLVTDLMGSSISMATGDYSRGASGFWIENGQIAYPVSEMTIAGNLADMFLRMTPASDLEFRYGIDAPSLLVEGMTTASR